MPKPKKSPPVTRPKTKQGGTPPEPKKKGPLKKAAEWLTDLGPRTRSSGADLVGSPPDITKVGKKANVTIPTPPPARPGHAMVSGGPAKLMENKAPKPKRGRRKGR